MYSEATTALTEDGIEEGVESEQEREDGLVRSLCYVSIRFCNVVLPNVWAANRMD